MALPWTGPDPGPFRCLWPGCDHISPVGSMAYAHMTTCPHRPQETR